MAIWNLGSINADFVYSVPHLPAPGETLSSTNRQVFLGGKGQDGRWAVERLLEYGVITTDIAEIETETAQAIIAVDQQGENSIILHSGANAVIPETLVKQALSKAETGDWFICQNETNQQAEAAILAKQMGLKVGYAAAPFDVAAVDAVLPVLDFLILNEVEMAQMTEAKGVGPADLGIEVVIVTKGADGCTIFDRSGETSVPAIPVDPVDTTGAGDTFTGYVLACLDRGLPLLQAVNLATRAGALMVTRHGTADVIPDLSEVQAFQA